MSSSRVLTFTNYRSQFIPTQMLCFVRVVEMNLLLYNQLCCCIPSFNLISSRQAWYRIPFHIAFRDNILCRSCHLSVSWLLIQNAFFLSTPTSYYIMISFDDVINELQPLFQHCHSYHPLMYPFAVRRYYTCNSRRQGVDLQKE